MRPEVARPLISSDHTSKQNVMCLDCTLIWLPPPANPHPLLFLIQNVPEFKKLIMIFFLFFFCLPQGLLADKITAVIHNKSYRWNVDYLRQFHSPSSNHTYQHFWTNLNVNLGWANAIIFTTYPSHFQKEVRFIFHPAGSDANQVKVFHTCFINISKISSHKYSNKAISKFHVWLFTYLLGK